MSDNIEYLFFEGLNTCAYNDFMDAFEELSLNEFHQQLGVHSAPSRNKDGICYAPVSLKDEGEWKLSFKKRRRNDVEYKLPPIADVNQLGFHCNHPDTDAVFDKIVPGSVLDKIGIQPTDRVFEVNGQEVSTMSEALKEILNSEKSNVNISVYKEDGTYRNDDNVKSINTFVLDLDEEGSIEEARKVFSGYDYTIHSTHSHTKDTPYKFRMIVSLDKPIEADSWPLCFASVAAAIGIDRNCGNLSRVYFFPSQSLDAGIAPHAEYCKGKKLTFDDIMSLGRRHNVDLSEILARSERNFDMPTEFNYVHGTVSGYYRKASPKCDLVSMENRHMKNLNALKSSRNSFVKKVIDYEIFAYGEKADLKQVVNFCILKASNPNLTPFCKNEFSQGDTPSDIIDLIITATEQSSSRDIFRAMYPNINVQLEAMVRDAIIRAMKPGLLESDFPLSDADKKTKSINKNLHFGYDDIKARHSETLNQLKSGEIDRKNFVDNVVKDEITINGPGKIVNIKHFAQFLYRSSEEFSGSAIHQERSDYIGKIFEKYANELAPGTYKFPNLSALVAKQCDSAHDKLKNKSWDTWKAPKAAAVSSGAGLHP